MKSIKPSNPNGANQYLLDPRQKICWDYYIHPKSETFSNAYKSALRAGYEDTTATQITTEVWFIERVRRLNMLGKAEKVLDEMLEIEEFSEDLITGKKKRDPSLSKIKQDTAKFVAERLGKNDGYSSRNEVTGADGKDLEIKEIKYITPESPIEKKETEPVVEEVITPIVTIDNGPDIKTDV